MKVSYRWLRDLAPGIVESAEELADRLAMLGAPVEELSSPGAGLGDILVARVLDYGPHPNADRLSLCTVDAGGDEPLQVVCGAPVIEKGGLYPFAPVGATLPGGMQLRKAKIRGEYSHGMLCSEAELELGPAAGGIMRLVDGLPVGERFVDALQLDDTTLTLEVTANRPDLLSHMGVAREVAPDGHHGLQLPPFPREDVDERTDATAPPLELRRVEREGLTGGIRVCIEDPEGCPRYMAAVIEGVTVGPSPDWLAARLRAIGQRPINNVVDATNYVLHELGQPLHAFDRDRIGGQAIIVRRAAADEPIVTLDDEERTLRDDMLVIADAERPVAVAGVMGGADSEVTDATTAVLLECAHFHPGSVRNTARALGLSTDASYRFERGADIDAMPQALHRVVELIQTIAGGDIIEEALDVYPAPREAPVVTLRPSRVERLLGESIPADEIRHVLGALGFELQEREDDALGFAVPGFRRYDVTREVDLIEEVARRHGYDRLGDAIQPYRPTAVPDAPLSRLEDRLRDVLVARGLLESRRLPMAPVAAGVVPLLRPLSAEEGALRATLTHGLLRSVELNMARGVRDVRLFEIGTTFHAAPAGEPPREETRVAVAIAGRRRPRHWQGETPDFDVWDATALLADLGRELGLSADAVRPLDGGEPDGLSLPGTYRPGWTVALFDEGGGILGVAGRVADDAADLPAWAPPVFAAEVRLSADVAERGRPVVGPVPTQPPSDRDLALIVPDALPAADVAATIRDAAGDLLESLSVFDVYEGKGIPAGTRSVAYRLVFRHPERTLKDQEVDEAISRVLERLEHVHGVERRG